MVAEQATRRLRAGLAEDVERWEREDTALGPEVEPENRFVLRSGRWVRVKRELAVLPPLLPPGYVPAFGRRAECVVRTEPGSDELRIKHLMVEAIDRFGSARVGGAL